jgi:hypothetical protein
MAWVLIATDDFVHLKCLEAAGSREATEGEPSRSRRPRLQLAIDGPDGAWTKSCFRNLACPPALEKFLKQFTALLREHAAVDIAAMI